MEHEVLISIVNESPRQQEVLIGELNDILNSLLEGPNTVERRNADDRAQSMGAELVVLLGTPAVIAVAKGIQAWLQKRNSLSINIESKDLSISIKNANAGDASKLLSKALENIKVK